MQRHLNLSIAYSTALLLKLIDDLALQKYSGNSAHVLIRSLTQLESILSIRLEISKLLTRLEIPAAAVM